MFCACYSEISPASKLIGLLAFQGSGTTASRTLTLVLPHLRRLLPQPGAHCLYQRLESDVSGFGIVVHLKGSLAATLAESIQRIRFRFLRSYETPQHLDGCLALSYRLYVVKVQNGGMSEI